LKNSPRGRFPSLSRICTDELHRQTKWVQIFTAPLSSFQLKG
jgi:hypothetical protein